MKIERDALLPALQHAARCASGRDDVTGHVLLSAADGTLAVCATDYDVAGTATAACDGEIDACAPVKALTAIVNALPEGATLTLHTDDNQRLHIECGRSRYAMACLPPGAFPPVPPQLGDATATFDAALLRAMLARVAPCVSRDDRRPAIAGVHLHVVDGMLWAVATDGHRLSLDAVVFAGGLPPVTIHRRALSVLMPMLAAETVATVSVVVVWRGGVVVTCGALSVRARAINDAFPEYSRIVPNPTPRSIAVDSSVLLAELDRVAMLAKSADSLVVLSVDGTAVSLDASNLLGQAHAETVGEGALAGKWRVNPAYLRDALCQLGGTVAIQAGDQFAPMLLTSDAAPHAKIVMMPMRLPEAT